MLQYKVRSGQNIYDVALALHGSVEGVFDLLVSNEWLNMETKLTCGMVLNYHEEFVVNQNIALWLKSNGILVKNGEHSYAYFDVELFAKEHIASSHPDICEQLQQMSPDEQEMYWEAMRSPRMIVKQQGRLSAIRARLKAGQHMIVDWGDYSSPQIVEGRVEQTAEHCYKGSGIHAIVMYGDFECELLDFSDLNGLYYPLGAVYASQFVTPIDDEKLNKLIITQ